MAISVEQADRYVEERYPFYVAFQLDAAVSLLEKAVDDYRASIPNATHRDFVAVALKHVEDDKRVYYTEITQVVWDRHVPS